MKFDESKISFLWRQAVKESSSLYWMSYGVDSIWYFQEEEREGLLEQYKNLTVEANTLEQSNSRLENDASYLKAELQAKETELKSLRDNLHAQEEEIQDHIDARNQLQLEVLLCLSAGNRNKWVLSKHLLTEIML